MAQQPSGRGPTRVRNRAPAQTQITAEYILREALESQQMESSIPEQRITTAEELASFKMKKRTDFENAIRKERNHMGTWYKYAVFEEKQEEWTRARSIYERAIEVDYRNPTLWRRYAEMEMKNRFVNHARNIWTRAVTLLPRVEQLWYRYVYMEEMLECPDECRKVFDRWMQWEPAPQAWLSYVKFEERAERLEMARAVFPRFARCHPVPATYVKWAKWERHRGALTKARAVYEDAVEVLPPDDAGVVGVLVAFARFEEGCAEVERARAIFKFGAQHLPEANAEGRLELREALITFEKKHGDRVEIDGVVVGKRRAQYEASVAENAHDYDTWFDLARLEEAEATSALDTVAALEAQLRAQCGEGAIVSDTVEVVEARGVRDAAFERVRGAYGRAVVNVPVIREQRYWARYIFLFLGHATWEELVAEDAAAARAVYRAAIAAIPHKHFTFPEVWVMAAHFELRQLEIANARRTLGHSIGACPTEQVFQEYIQLELQLGEVDRCRTLYAKYLQFAPFDSNAWAKFAELEDSVGEVARARAVYELAVSQEELDRPELLWKFFIDFEIALAEIDNAVVLYERLLERTQHVKVFISFGKFLAENERTEEARDCFLRAEKSTKEGGMKEERVQILDALLAFEKSQPNGGEAKEVVKRMPKRVRKRRPVNADDAAAGIATEWEECVLCPISLSLSLSLSRVVTSSLCSITIAISHTHTTLSLSLSSALLRYYDYVFPEDSQGVKGLAILEMARKWKEAQEAAAAKEAAAEATDSCGGGVKRKAGESGDVGGEPKRSRGAEDVPQAAAGGGGAEAGAAADECEIDIDDL